MWCAWLGQFLSPVGLIFFLGMLDVRIQTSSKEEDDGSERERMRRSVKQCLSAFGDIKQHLSTDNRLKKRRKT